MYFCFYGEMLNEVEIKCCTSDLPTFRFDRNLSQRQGKILFSGQLGQNFGELPFTHKFFCGPISFFLRILLNIFFSYNFLCGIKHIVNMDSYSINISSLSRVRRRMCSVVERIGGYRSIFGRFVLLSCHRKAFHAISPQVKAC